MRTIDLASNDGRGLDVPKTHPSLIWLGITLFLVLLFDPGIMSNDSIASLKQARAFEFTSWHPPIMAIIWSVLDRIIAGPAGMLLCQAALYAYASARLCAYAFPNLSRFVPAWLVVAVFSLFPPAMALVGMIWKDVWMSGFLLLALAHLFELRDAVGKAKRVRLAISIVAFALIATAFRHNAIGATAGLLACMVHFLLSDRYKPLIRLGLASLAGVLLAIVLLLATSLFNRLVASPSRITTAILLHDIAGIVINSENPAATVGQVLSLAPQLTDDHAKFMSRLQRKYSPASGSRLLRSKSNVDAPFIIDVYSSEHDADGVKVAWRQLVKTHPGAYIHHRTETFRCLMQLCDRDEWIFHSYVMNPKYAFPDTLAEDSWQATLRHMFLSPRLAILYSPAFWLLVTVVGGIYGLGRYRTGPVIILYMSLSSVGLASSLYFTSPVECYRYVHWIILLGWCMLLLLLDGIAARSPARGKPISS